MLDGFVAPNMEVGMPNLKDQRDETELLVDSGWPEARKGDSNLVLQLIDTDE